MFEKNNEEIPFKDLHLKSQFSRMENFGGYVQRLVLWKVEPVDG